MTDIFVSYAREDKNFVHDLHDAIEEHDREVWVDWQDIPPTAEWFEEIKSAIDSSDTFVFIITPDSLSSQICRGELLYAVEQHKRLLPVLRREVYAQDIPTSIAKINWVFFRQNDDFATSMVKLIDAIETDLDLVRTHTRLLVRAKEWAIQDRDKSLLLRGLDLQGAERWLEHAREQAPTPTLLHSQYISASRKAATKRQHKTLIATALSLIIAITLAAVAYYQRNIAEDQRQIALARQLAAQAVSLSDQKPDLALLLSLEANRIIDTAEVRGSLFSILQANQHIITAVRDDIYWTRVAFSSDNQTVAYSGHDNNVTLFDTLTGQASILSKHNKSVYSVTFNPDGKKLASGSYDGTVILWDVDKRQAIGEPLGNHDKTVWSVAFSPDGNLLAAGSEDNINLYDVNTHRLIGQLPSSRHRRIMSLVFSPDGQMLISGSCEQNVCESGEIRVWDVNSRSLQHPPIFAHNEEIWDLAISPDGKTMVSASYDSSIIFWDLETLVPLGPPIFARGGGGLVFSPDGKLLLSGGGNNISLWDVSSRTLLSSRLQHNAVKDVAISSDGETVVSVGKGMIIFWDISANDSAIRTLSGHKASVTGLAFTPEGKNLISSSLDGQIIFWNMRTGEPTGNELTSEKGLLSMELSADGRRLATTGRRAPVLWDVTTGTPLDPPLDGRGRPESLRIAFSPDSKILASGGKWNRIALWNLRTSRQLKSFYLDCCVWSLTFSPDGRTLISGGDNGIVQWDLNTGERINFPTNPNHHKLILSVVISPNGELLASGSYDGSIILWDAKTLMPVGPPIDDYLDNVWALAFSPDGNILIAGGSDGAILMWDVPASQLFLPLQRLHTDRINSLSFSPDGKYVASGGDDQRIRLWSVDSKFWRSQACKISNRNLSKEEWQQYIGDKKYELTCPDLAPLVHRSN